MQQYFTASHKHSHNGKNNNYTASTAVDVLIVTIILTSYNTHGRKTAKYSKYT